MHIWPKCSTPPLSGAYSNAHRLYHAHLLHSTSDGLSQLHSSTSPVSLAFVTTIIAYCCLQGYDQTIIPLVVVIVLVSVGALASLLGMLVFHVRAAVYARPLSYHMDVLNQK